MQPLLPPLQVKADNADLMVVSSENGVYIYDAPSYDAQIVASLACGQLVSVKQDDGGDWVLLYGGYVPREEMEVVDPQEAPQDDPLPEEASETAADEASSEAEAEETASEAEAEADEASSEAEAEADEASSKAEAEADEASSKAEAKETASEAEEASEPATDEASEPATDEASEEGAQENEAAAEENSAAEAASSEGDYVTTWDEEMGTAVADFAKQYVGLPYVWGGESLETGADCSGFTRAVYGHFGVELPHFDQYQRSYGEEVASLDDAKPGDLIFYHNHVAVYIGNYHVVNCSTEEVGTIISDVDYRSVEMIRRIFF